MFQHFTGFVYLFAVSQLVSLADAQSECPLQLDPQRVVVRYGGSVAVNCSTSVLHGGMGWEADEGRVPMTKDQNLITWRVSNLTEWDIKPFCYINLNDNRQCPVELPVTVYKTPDSVFISTVYHRGPMMEGQQYELQCDVHNVAPVQYLTVKWYKGQTLLNQTTFPNTSKTPVNKTVTLLIRPDRADDEAEYWCEAELDLGAEGPQPHPTNSSNPLSIAVYYKPKHSNSTETIIQDDKVMLDCTVKANPAPTYTWDHLKEKNSSSVLKSSALSLGNYTCTATNTLGRDSKVFIVKDGCPILLSPLDVVVEYGASFSVNCSYSATHQFGLSWDGFDDTVEESEEIFRFVDKVTDWETNLTCYMSSNETQCSQDLPITIYKTPDSVFISTVNHRGPMTEGQQYELQCDVYNVAPVQNLTVKWYKGQTLLHQTNFTDTIKTPVNETVTLLIRPDRADDGAEYWCAAELDLGAEGPQPHPTNSSKPLSIAVYFAPKILFCRDWSPLTETSLDSYPLNLYSAEGNPRPDVSWRHKSSSVNSSMPLTRYDSGLYEIIAGNDLNSVSCFMNITVEYAPVFYDSQEKFVVGEDSNITLECYSTGNPEPAMWWSFKNRNISTGRRHINIERATSTNAGVYTCSATNKFGRSDKTFIVEIKGLGYDSPNYILTVVVVVVFISLVLIILLVVLMWKRRKSRGNYEVHSEMQPLRNGDP